MTNDFKTVKQGQTFYKREGRNGYRVLAIIAVKNGTVHYKLLTCSENNIAAAKNESVSVSNHSLKGILHWINDPDDRAQLYKYKLTLKQLVR